MLQISTGMKSGLLAGVGFAGLFNGGHIRIFAGARPESADQSEDEYGATLLARITCNGLDPEVPGAPITYDVSGPYVVSNNFENWVVAGLADGDAAWFRIVGPDPDDGEASYDLPRMDGDVGTTVGAAELVIPDTDIAAGERIGPATFFYTIPSN